MPGYAMALLDRPTAELLGSPGAVHVVTVQGPLVLSSGDPAAGFAGTSISMTATAMLLVALAGVAGLARGWGAARRRLAPTWTCGMTPTSRFDYSATAFAKSLRLIFAMLYRPQRQIDRETAGSPYVVRRIHYASEVVDLAETTIYHRVQHAVTSVSAAIRARSTGRIHGYIGFVLVTLLVVLVLYGRG
jgi:hypothetical protein